MKRDTILRQDARRRRRELSEQAVSAVVSRDALVRPDELTNKRSKRSVGRSLQADSSKGDIDDDTVDFGGSLGGNHERGSESESSPESSDNSIVSEPEASEWEASGASDSMDEHEDDEVLVLKFA